MAHIAAELDRFGVAPGRLTLEITESVVMAVGDAFTLLARLRQIGISLALDDALVPLMAGLVAATGWMRSLHTLSVTRFQDFSFDIGALVSRRDTRGVRPDEMGTLALLSASDETVAVDHLIRHAEIARPVPHQLVGFNE